MLPTSDIEWCKHQKINILLSNSSFFDDIRHDVEITPFLFDKIVYTRSFTKLILSLFLNSSAYNISGLLSNYIGNCSII